MREQEAQARQSTDDIEESEFWSMYPQNVYLATTGSKNNGLSLQSKKMIIIFVLIFFTVALTVFGYMGGREYGFGLLASIIAFIVGVLVSIYVYGKLMRDKFNERFESDMDNKILKLFRVRISDLDAGSKLDDVDLMAYTSGEVFVTLRIEIGHSTQATEEATAEFLDHLFKSAHQLQLGIKNYNTRSPWRKSDVHHNHLRRMTKLQNEKLKKTLASIDAHQSKVFDDSKVIAIHLLFYTRKNNLNGLESIIRLVNDWKRENLFMSSIRTLDWLDKDKTIESMCDFLTIQMLDVTSTLNKKNVKYDTRKLVQVYSRDRFKPQEDIKVESRAQVIRKSKKQK